MQKLEETASIRTFKPSNDPDAVAPSKGSLLLPHGASFRPSVCFMRRPCSDGARVLKMSNGGVAGTSRAVRVVP